MLGCGKLMTQFHSKIGISNLVILSIIISLQVLFFSRLLNKKKPDNIIKKGISYNLKKLCIKMPLFKVPLVKAEIVCPQITPHINKPL